MEKIMTERLHVLIVIYWTYVRLCIIKIVCARLFVYESKLLSEYVIFRKRKEKWNC